MTTEPRLHVVTIAYNAERWLPELAHSVLRHDWVERWILVDDGSAVPAAESIGPLAVEHPGRVVVARRENGGEAAARNTAIGVSLAESARADPSGGSTWLLFIDADDRLHPSARRAILAAHAAGADAMGGSKLEFTGDSTPMLREPPPQWRDRCLDHPAEVLRFKAVLAATGMGLRHSALIGPDAPRWDPLIPMSCDVEFLYRIAGRGPVYVSTEPAVEYRQHPDGSSLSGRLNLRRRVAGFGRIVELHHAPGVDSLLHDQGRWILNQVVKHDPDPELYRLMRGLFSRMNWPVPLKARLRGLRRFGPFRPAGHRARSA